MISIIVPVFNSEKYLKKCIESVKNQEFKDWELILIDDGSTDDSFRICKEYTSDPRIKVKHIDNNGVSNARNEGLKLVSGDYVFFLDSDDYIDKNCLNWCAKIINQYKVDIVKFNYYKKLKNIKLKNNQYTIATNRIIKKAEYKELIYKNAFKTDDLCNVCGAIFSSKVISNIFFDTTIKLGEDFLFFIEALKKSNSIFFADEYLYYYIVGHESATRSSNIEKNYNLLINSFKANRKIENLLENNNERYYKSYRNFMIFINSIVSFNNYNDCKKIFKLYLTKKELIEEIEYIRKFIDVKDVDNLSKYKFYFWKLKLYLKRKIKNLLNK